MQDTSTSPQHERPLPLSGGVAGGLFSSAYLAPVHYYTKLYSCALAQLRCDGQEGIVVEEQADHYVKQTYRNRCIIAGNDGPIALTIPVSAPAVLPDGSVPPGISKTPMHAVLISEQGNWRHQHWRAIVSAYQSSPYFEYYADEFHDVFHRHYDRLVDFNAALRDYVLDALGLKLDIRVNTGRYIMLGDGDGQTLLNCNSDERNDNSNERNDNPDGLSFSGLALNDYREKIRPKVPYTFDPYFCPRPYWQVFASRHGFLPNMSIIDLLFNMGPESRIVLRDSIRTVRDI